MLRGLLALSAALLLPGCASTGAGSSSEPKTEIDRTDLDRRAAVRIELATGYFTRGQYDTALDEIKQALQLKPELREAINLRNLVYAAMGETAMAEEGFKRAVGSAPNDGDAMHNYAWFLCQQGRWAPSRALFDQALALPGYRGSSRTLLARGVCEARNGEWPAAERSLSKAFELDPANPA
ncbi:MAG TPA: tetratricopeptide repeat protein, partial [Burkholderiaceae bacterium]|nr:tetratricopeptide repeat protein [Burkholderiaceae bacterium]